jgi:hypothetical protein
MTTNISGSPNEAGSAKIYTFPLRGRFALRDQRDDTMAGASAALPRGVKFASGSGWYHDAAIQEAAKADRAGKN